MMPLITLIPLCCNIVCGSSWNLYFLFISFVIILTSHDWFVCIILLSCCRCAVRSMELPSFEIKTEADSSDINGCSQDDKPSTGEFVVFPDKTALCV